MTILFYALACVSMLGVGYAFLGRSCSTRTRFLLLAFYIVMVVIGYVRQHSF